MLNRIVGVQTKVRQIEGVAKVRLVEIPSRKFGYEEAERRCEVEALSDDFIQLSKGDVLSIMRQYSVIREGVEHGTRGSRIA